MYRKGIHILLSTLIVISTIAHSSSLILCYLEGDHLAVETSAGGHCLHNADFTKQAAHTFSEAINHQHGVHIDISLSFLENCYLDMASGKIEFTQIPADTILAAPSPVQITTPGNSIHTAHDPTPPPYLSLELHSTTVLLS